MPANAACLDEFIVRDWAFGRVARNQPGSRSFAESKHVSTFCLIQCLSPTPPDVLPPRVHHPLAVLPRVDVQLPSVAVECSVPSVHVFVVFPPSVSHACCSAL